MSFRNDSNARLTAWLLATLLAVGLAPAPAAQEAARIVPYNGYIELDGQALDGDLSIEFTLWNDGSVPLWTETWSDDDQRSCGAQESCFVSILDGRFSVALGRWVDLEDVILAVEPLYLSMAVRGSDGLYRGGGFQQLHPAAFSHYASIGTDLEVSGQLDVTGELQAAGAIVTGDLSNAGNLTASTAHATVLVETSSDLTVPAASAENVISSGVVVVADELTFSDGTTPRTALRPSNNLNTLLVNPDREFADVTIGNATASDLWFEGPVTLGDAEFGVNAIAGDEPWFEAYHFDIGEGTDYDTGISSSRVFCWIGGVLMVGGASDVVGVVAPIRWYTYEQSGTWWVKVDIASDGVHETHSFSLICANQGLVNERGWF